MMSIQIAEEYFKAVTNMLLTSNSYEPNGLTEWRITRSGSIGPKRDIHTERIFVVVVVVRVHSHL
jgi:hypothetical protein